jgi:hypothetical protein
LCRIIEGAFNLRPVVRSTEVWQVDQVLEYLRSWGSNESLSFKQLFLKSLTLVALVSACRVSELANFSNSYVCHRDSWSFQLLKVKKNSSIKNNKLGVDIFAFCQKELCPLACLQLYLAASHVQRQGCDRLFLTLSRPFRAARPNTLARHLKSVLQGAGIDILRFSAHSFRAATTSKALTKGVPLEEILSRATWASESTFSKFYAKKLIQGQQFSEGVLRPVTLK